MLKYINEGFLIDNKLKKNLNKNKELSLNENEEENEGIFNKK